MPRPAPNLADQEPSVSAELPEEGDFDFEDIRIRKPPPAWTTTAIVSCVVAWGALAVHNLIVLPKLDGVPPVSFDRITTARKGVPRSLLFALRMGTFLYGLFFVAYHLGYEESKKHTDGFQYLSDWTFVLLCFTEGALAWNMQRVEKNEGDFNTRTNVMVILYSVCWSMNLVASAGAWYSFFFYPMCKTLEGVDNYPACYLEWYRLSEHALNLLILALEYAFGTLPMRRRDFGWSILFMQFYIFFTWIILLRTGHVVYDMFYFDKGLSALAWYNGAFFGTGLAFFLSLKIHQPKGYRTNGRAGIFTYERVAGEGETAPLVA